MQNLDRLRSLGLFDARVPRYTSYPTAPVFSPDVGGVQQREWIAALDPAVAVSVYIHIPFCERLCWFCACRTQGTKTLAPVEAYLDALEAEVALVREAMPAGMRMERVHWGGGTPTILPPEMIHRVGEILRSAFTPTDSCEFSVEIDPTLVDAPKIAALRSEGMNRASIGIQDFDPQVQAAIGREQPYEVTRDCVEMLRDHGIGSLNADLVYGLPWQDEPRIRDTVSKVLTLGPDRVALFGYAHVPWVAKRQKLIPDDSLPGPEARHGLSRIASDMFTGAGYDIIGIDHFARPEDGLATAARVGRLRRNFQGYTDDSAQTLIGLGASSISRFPQGYMQNAPATNAYAKRVLEGDFAGARGHALSGEDRCRSRAIEMLMCDFRMDLFTLMQDFPDARTLLAGGIDEVIEVFGDLVSCSGDVLEITSEGRPLTRMIAARFDAYMDGQTARFSQAS